MSHQIYQDKIKLRVPPRLSIWFYQPAHWNLERISRKWYYRALVWLLGKLGGSDFPASYPVQEYFIEQSAIRQMIEQTQGAMMAFYSKEATTLIIGYDEMQKLMDEPPTTMMQFKMDLAVSYGDYDPGTGRNRIQTRRGPLRVVLVPWLEGWALLPDLDH